MKFSAYQPLKSIKSKIGFQSGIKPSNNTDAVLENSLNLNFLNGCQTRNGRTPTLILEQRPDQIIFENGKTYFRFGNQIKSAAVQNGQLALTGENFSLSSEYDNQDRKLYSYNGRIYVLPDMMVIKPAGTPFSYGSVYTVAKKFPFIDSRTLYFDSGFSTGSSMCEDCRLLTRGREITFSWDTAPYKIIKCEESYYKNSSGGNRVLAGIRITLDRAVTGYNAISSNATATVRDSGTEKMNTVFYASSRMDYDFFGNKITVSTTDSEKTYCDSFADYFHVGQYVDIADTGVSAFNRRVCITKVEDDCLTFDVNLGAKCQVSGRYFSITGVIPNASAAIISDERLIIVDQNSGEIWLSKKGDPTMFYSGFCGANDANRVLLTGLDVAYQLAESNGEIYLFSGTGIYRLYGSNATGYTAFLVNPAILPKENMHSVATTGKEIVYCANGNLYLFKQNTCKCITKGLHLSPNITWAVCCNDVYYGLDTEKLYCYSAADDILWLEDRENIDRIFAMAGKLFIEKNGTIYAEDAAAKIHIPWQFETGEIFDTQNGGRVTPLGIELFCTSPERQTLSVELITDRHKTVLHKTAENKQLLTFKFPAVACRSFCIRVSGSAKVQLKKAIVLYRRNVE